MIQMAREGGERSRSTPKPVDRPVYARIREISDKTVHTHTHARTHTLVDKRIVC